MPVIFVCVCLLVCLSRQHLTTVLMLLLSVLHLVVCHLVPVSQFLLWRPQLPYAYSYKASCARPG